jgi:nucleoside-diphosphate-sugar epimerase
VSPRDEAGDKRGIGITHALAGNTSAMTGRRIVVTGATGNIGTSVVRALSEHPGVASVVGVARRQPAWTVAKTEWVAADVRDDLTATFDGADAVIHLAWQFQPTHAPEQTWRANVLGSKAVFAAVAAARVPALVHASSVGAYSPGPKDRPVDESWPTDGWPQAAYTREKAYLERVLDGWVHGGSTKGGRAGSMESGGMGGFDDDVRVVRIRPAFVFKHAAAQEQRRIFASRLIPTRLVGLIPVVPDLPGLVMQAVHADDLAQAFTAAALGHVSGPFNIAADPVVDVSLLADLLHARPVRMPTPPVRAALALAWRLRLVGASPDLFDAVLRLPLMDTTRARKLLGWQPRYTARDALGEFLTGLEHPTALPTPPLSVSGG